MTRCFCSSKNCLMELFYFTVKQERNLQLPSFPKWKGLVMATATTRKTVCRASPENEHLYNCNHFAFISSCLYLAMLLEYAATKLQGELLNRIWRVQDLLLQLSSNCSNFKLLIRRKQYRIFLQCRTRNTIIFAPSNYEILNLLHCHSHCRRRCYGSLTT